MPRCAHVGSRTRPRLTSRTGPKLILSTLLCTAEPGAGELARDAIGGVLGGGGGVAVLDGSESVAEPPTDRCSKGLYTLITPRGISNAVFAEGMLSNVAVELLQLLVSSTLELLGVVRADSSFEGITWWKEEHAGVRTPSVVAC